MDFTRLPKLIAFDLDGEILSAAPPSLQAADDRACSYTLWDLWIDTHVTPPIKRTKDEINRLTDRYDQEISFYPDVPQILQYLRDKGDVTIAACSRTHTPALAREALDLLLLPATPSSPNSTKAITYFDELEIYPGSKIAHFKALHKKTGIPHEEMLFFDDESRNKEVSKLGVTFVLTPRGVNRKVFEKGVKVWAESFVIEEAKEET